MRPCADSAMKANELREMSDEQLRLTLKETAEGFFRLRTQASNRATRRSKRIAKEQAIDSSNKNNPT